MTTNGFPIIAAGRNKLLHSAALLLIIASALWIYFSSLSYGFLNTWDDNFYITFNPSLRGFTKANLIDAFISFRVGTYGPLHILSYMIDHLFWGFNPIGYRIDSLFLHILNGCLLYGLTIRLHHSKAWAICAALLFVVHPVQVESVAWMSERKNLLALTFFLGAFHAYTTYRASGKRLAYGTSLLLFACACLTKSVVVVFPLILLLYDLLMAENRNPHILKDKVPYAAMAAFTAWMAMISQSMPGVGGGATGLHGGSLSSHILTSLSIVPGYLGMLLRPAELSALYTIDITRAPDITTAFSAALILLGIAIGYLLYRRQKPLCFWYLTAIICILPVAQIVPLVTLRNDRYLYFPMIGIAILYGFSADYLQRRFERGWFAVIILHSALLLFLALASHERSHVWKDDLTLWEDATRKEPGCDRAWFNLGGAYYSAGNLPDAAEAVLKSLELDKTSTLYLRYLVAAYADMGRYQMGKPYAERLVELEPDSYVGHKNLGIALFEAGRVSEARQHLDMALKARPNDPAVLQQLDRMGSGASSP